MHITIFIVKAYDVSYRSKFGQKYKNKDNDKEKDAENITKH